MGHAFSKAYDLADSVVQFSFYSWHEHFGSRSLYNFNTDIWRVALWFSLNLDITGWRLPGYHPHLSFLPFPHFSPSFFGEKIYLLLFIVPLRRPHYLAILKSSIDYFIMGLILVKLLGLISWKFKKKSLASSYFEKKFCK